jgi:uncharacterized membrane protein
MFVTLVSAIIVSLAGAVMIEPLGGWRPVDMTLLLHIVFSSVGLLVGYQFIVLAMRTGEISFIAPFRYTSLLWSILFGILFFSELPDIWMISGSVIVIGSQVLANSGFNVVASSSMTVNGQRTQNAAIDFTCQSSMTIAGNLKWVAESDTAETWDAISDNAETWTPITDTSETWAAIDDSSESWTAIADNSETWQIAA